MIDRLDQAFQFNQQALNLRHERQSLLAGNIANADTPGYKARDMDFAKALEKATGVDTGVKPLPSVTMARTHAGHLKGEPAPMSGRGGEEDVLFRIPDQPSMDGNTVDMNKERAHFVDNSVRYQSAITAINGQIRSMRKAMQE